MDGEVNCNVSHNAAINCDCRFLKDALPVSAGVPLGDRESWRRIRSSGESAVMINLKSGRSRVSRIAKRNYKAIYSTPSPGITFAQRMRAHETFFARSVDLFARGCMSYIVLVWHRPSILDR